MTQMSFLSLPIYIYILYYYIIFSPQKTELIFDIFDTSPDYQ